MNLHGFRFIAGEILFLKYLLRSDEIREDLHENIVEQVFVAIYKKMSGNQELYMQNVQFCFLRNFAGKMLCEFKIIHN